LPAPEVDIGRRQVVQAFMVSLVVVVIDERFNRSYRNEVLNTWLFHDLDEVREITWAWMLEYNEERDHEGLGGLTPAEVLANAKLSTLEWST
jgi:putative transposase